MIKEIGSYLNQLQSRFTYRQRFIFFSLIYVLAMPYPAYWMIVNENFLIDKIERQILGLEVLSSTNDIMHLFIQQNLTYVFPAQSESLENKITQHILDESNKLDFLLEKAALLRSTSLGNVFSDAKPVFQKIDVLEDSYGPPFSFDIFKQNMERFSAGLAQQRKMFDIDLNLNPAAQGLTKINFYLLPNVLVNASSLFFLRYDNKGDVQKQLQNTIALEYLKKHFEQIQSLLKSIYRSGDKEFLRNLSFFQTSMIEYRDVVENFIDLFTSPSSLDLSEKKYEAAFLRVIQQQQMIWKSSASILKSYYEHLLHQQRLEKYLCLAIIFLASVVVCLFVLLKVLSRHLLAIYDHIQDLAKGNFSKCFCSDATDEFGPVGLAFDKMGNSFQNVVSELRKLGKQLTDSITQITKTAKEQEWVVAEQEKGIKEIELTAKLIGMNSRDLAGTMNDLSLSTKQNSLPNLVKSGLDRMHGKMSELTAASTNILNTLVAIQEKVASAKSIVDIMSRVSDQANLISLNAAIETTNVGQDKKGFEKITQEIQRFAEKTAGSMKDIQSIIKEMSINVSAVGIDANSCLKEINEGIHRLALINNQVRSISNQGKEQGKKFDSVNDVMQVQAFAAEGIIISIDQLTEVAQENTRYTTILFQTAEELGITVVELQDVLDLFFTKI